MAILSGNYEPEVNLNKLRERYYVKVLYGGQNIEFIDSIRNIEILAGRDYTQEELVEIIRDNIPGVRINIDRNRTIIIEKTYLTKKYLSYNTKIAIYNVGVRPLDPPTGILSYMDFVK